MTSPALTLYYDGKCAFCTTEMGRLARWDRACDGVLAFVDVSRPGFDPAHLHASMADLNARMHALTGDGRVLAGIDAMLAAYTLAGRGYLVWPLRVPGLRALLSWLYLAFARKRYTMSRLLGYKLPAACEEGVCQPGNPFLSGRSKP